MQILVAGSVRVWSKQGSDKDTKKKKTGNEMSMKGTEKLLYFLGYL